MFDPFAERIFYLSYVAVVAIGVYLMLTHRNLLGALIGLSMVQSGIILFYVLLAARRGASVPILEQGVALELHDPLPHALMLTAIVVGFATVGMGVAILHRIHGERGSLADEEEDG